MAVKYLAVHLNQGVVHIPGQLFEAEVAVVGLLPEIFSQGLKRQVNLVPGVKLFAACLARGKVVQRRQQFRRWR